MIYGNFSITVNNRFMNSKSMSGWLIDLTSHKLKLRCFSIEFQPYFNMHAWKTMMVIVVVKS